MKKQKELKNNLVSVRLNDMQLAELQKLSDSGVCERQTLSSALQYLINKHTIQK